MRFLRFCLHFPHFHFNFPSISLTFATITYFDRFSDDVSQLHGASPSTAGNHYKIDAEFVGACFRDYIMPLTKDVEVDYLLARLDQ